MYRSVNTVLYRQLRRPDRCTLSYRDSNMRQALSEGERNNSTKSMLNVMVDMYSTLPSNLSPACYVLFASPTPPPPPLTPLHLVDCLRAQGRDEVRRVFHVELRSVLGRHLRSAHRRHYGAANRIRFLHARIQMLSIFLVFEWRSPRQSSIHEEATRCVHAPAIFRPGRTDHHRRQRQRRWRRGRWRWWRRRPCPNHQLAYTPPLPQEVCAFSQ